MGDHCYMEVTVRKTDALKFEEILELEGVQARPDESVPGALHYVIEESNYAHYDPRLDAAKAGCVFFGFHTTGTEYSPREFAAADGVYEEAIIDIADAFLLVQVSVEQGVASVAADGIAEVQRYLNLRKRAKELMAAACQAEDGQG